MPSSPRKVKRRKDKSNLEGDKESKPVKQEFAGNHFTGCICQTSLGARFLEGSNTVYIWKNGIRFEGPFLSSHIDGRGRLNWPDGSTYEGELMNGRRHGDGVYQSADGMTMYEGQWSEGKRHGFGRLTFDASGDSYYEGQWVNGCKHGEGKQMWPSGNSYSGQWSFGKMYGHGTMIWCDGGAREQYSGNWEDNLPQGDGTYMWLAPEPKVDQDARNAPTQQMNNRYSGEWNKGFRHGVGTFHYANGAEYNGDWNENSKTGDGRYTFEDGCVYRGTFDKDQMSGSHAPVPSMINRAALNIGGEDNPVRRCIDVSDLLPFALPLDVGGHDLNSGSGYDEAEEVMREVHNMLLRYLGELKQLYSRYRQMLYKEGVDPYVLSTHQFWLFARDLDLMTPSCSLSRINRFISSGPRQHEETDHVSAAELRPLTPRSVLQEPAKSPSVVDPKQPAEIDGRSVSRHSVASSQHGLHDDMETDSQGSSNQESVHEEPEKDEANGQGGDKVSEHESPQVAWKSFANLSDIGFPPADVQNQFWRNDQKSLKDIHNCSHVLMFRHFLEGIVRISLARFPNEKGLEFQIRRLFKEKIQPTIGAQPEASGPFDFLIDQQIAGTFTTFETDLRELFKKHASKQGWYGPHDLTIVKEGDENGRQSRASGSRPSSTARSFTTTVTRRKSCGGQHRNTHVMARLDVTIRVKDVLQLFAAAGLMRFPRGEEGPDLAKNLVGPVFAVPEEAPIEQRDEGMEVFEGLQGLQMSLEQSVAIAAEQLAPESDLDLAETHPGGQRAGSENAGDHRHPPPVSHSPTVESISGKLMKKGLAGGLGVLSRTGTTRTMHEFLNMPKRAGSETPVSVSQSEVVDNAVEDKEAESLGDEELDNKEAPDMTDEQVVTRNDFTMSFHDVLRIIVEVMLPEGVERLCWGTKGDADPRDELVALLDYAETELTFIEFQRLLLRFAEIKLKEIAPPPRCLQIFLAHVFFPALREPYAMVLPDEEVPNEPENPEEGKQPSEEQHEEVEPPPPELPPQFWHGFDDDDDATIDKTNADRIWLDGYEMEVAEW